MLAGRCSCDTVRYAVEDAFRYAGYCHCSRCRASSGAAFTAFAGIEKEKLEVTQGAAEITIFEKNPDDLVSFCRQCGSVLFSVVREGRFLHVTMGTLVDDPAIRPMFHIFVGSKAPWHEIADALPQYPGFPPAQALGTSGLRRRHRAMIDGLLVALTCLAVLGSSLIAGVFFAFSAFVMTALGRLPPHQGIAAMQSINIAVINPWFFAAFFGTAAASAVLAIASLFRWGEPGAMLLLAGGGLYLVGSILVTMLSNVPLNDALAAAEAKSTESAGLWKRYLVAWTAWNHLRTAASLAAAAAFLLALMT